MLQNKPESSNPPTPGRVDTQSARLLLKAIVDSTSDMIWSVDAHAFGLLTFNRALADYFLRERGITIKVGYRPQDLFPPGEFVERWETFYRRALSEGPFQAEYQDPAGTLVLELHFNLLKQEEKAFGVSVFGRDVTGRVQAEKALRESEEKFRYMFEYSVAPKSITQLNGEMQVNQAFCDMLGYSRQEMDHRTWQELTHPEDVELNQLAVQPLLSGEKDSVRFTKRFIHKNGSIVWADIGTAMRRGPDGEPLYQITTINDITARRQAELALKESEEKLRSIFASSPDPITVVDLQGTITLCNQASAEMHGYTSADQLIGLNFLDLVAQEEPPKTRAIMQEVVKLGMMKDVPYTGLKTNGDTYAGEMSISLIRDGSGQPSGFVGITKDVSGRNLAEQVLRRRESYLSAILENQPGLVWLKDTQGRFLAVNQAFALSTGMNSPHDLTGKTDLDIWPLELAEKYRADDAQIMESKTSIITEEPIFDRGKMTWFETFKAPVLDENGEVIGTTGFSRDISAARLAKTELEQSEKRYRRLFEDSPVSLWEEDFSQVKLRLDRLKQSGVTDFRTYLSSHPQEMLACLQAIKVLDVNQATLKMMRASQKSQLFGYFHQVVPTPPAINFLDEFVSIAEGKTEFEWEGINYDLEGRMLNASLRWVVASGYAESLEKVLVSVMDVTERRQAQQLQQAVYQVAAAAETTNSLEQLYPQIHQIITSVMPAENFYIALYDEVKNLLRFPYFQNLEDAPFVNGVHPGRGATAYVLRTGKSLLATQAVHDELERRGEIILLGVPSAIWLGVPLIVEGKTIGAMVVQHYTDPQAYGEREQHMLEFVSTQVAIAISRLQAEEQLRQSEEKFRLIMEQITDLVFQTDQQGILSYVSPSSRVIFGYLPSEMVGHPFSDFLAVPDKERGMATFGRAVSTGRTSQNLELAMQHKDGSQFLGEVNGSLSRNKTGTGEIGLIRDITERKKTEDEIRRLNATLEQRVQERTRALEEAQVQLVRQEKLATLGQLAAGVGHELRNPLGAINTSAYYLKLVLPEASDKVKQHLEMIEQDVFTASRIIGDLLDFGRIITPEQQYISAAELVERALKRFPPPATVRVQRRLPTDLPKVFVDPLHAEQILGNLVTNACQSMPVLKAGEPGPSQPSGRLNISTAVKDGMLAISVKDNGSGINAENMKKLFEPLFTTKTRGIGLGLAVSKKLAEANHGWIAVRSKPGQGSTFTLYLPTSK